MVVAGAIVDRVVEETETNPLLGSGLLARAVRVVKVERSKTRFDKGDVLHLCRLSAHIDFCQQTLE